MKPTSTHTTVIEMLPLTGSFAENKDVARSIRLTTLAPAIQKKERVILDFAGVDGATQSFIHALISELIRENGVEALDLLFFKNCNETVQKIVRIVTDYLQETQ